MSLAVAVIAETDQGALTESTLECVQEAQDVAEAIGGCALVLLAGDDVARLATELGNYGADAVTVVQHEALAEFSADGWLAALEPELLRVRPAFILAPDSGRTRCWLPRLALRWRAPFIAGCVQLRPKPDGSVDIVRSSYGGNLEEHLACSESSTLVVTFCPGIGGLDQPQIDRRCDVRYLTPELNVDSIRDRTIRQIAADPKTVDIAEAERIVAGGLGIGGPEGMDVLFRLAERLRAAAGGTRVLVDRGLLPLDRQIGATGKIVAPKLYFALGISGAGQHISGMTGSETVIVVNSDETAPIFALADLGVVGDLHEVVPALLRHLERRE